MSTVKMQAIKSFSLKNTKMLLAALLLTFFAPIAFAQDSIMSAPTAFEKSLTGDLIVLDIRSSKEWKESGVAKGALPISMHEAAFPKRLQRVLSNLDANKIALICATGGRTAYMRRVLESKGISGVFDVSEGMFGNGSGPGWITRKLPIVTLDEALAHYESIQKSWN